VVKVAENSDFGVHLGSRNCFDVDVNGQVSQRQELTQTAVFASILFLVAKKAKEMVAEVTFLTKDVFEFHTSSPAQSCDTRTISIKLTAPFPKS
jgi:hypothetical protein